MKFDLSAFYIVCGAGLGVLSIFFIKYFFGDDYIQLREIIVFSSLIGVLLPLGLDSSHFLLNDNRAILSLIFWLNFLLIGFIGIYWLYGFGITFIFSFIVSISILTSALFRFKSLELFFLFNNIIFKIFQILLLLFWHFYSYLFTYFVLISCIVLSLITFKFLRYLTFKYVFIGLQGFVVSQFNRLPYIYPFWQMENYFLYDIYISISGLFWSVNLIYDRKNEDKLSRSTSEFVQYFTKFWKYQFVVLLGLFVIAALYFKLSNLFLESFVLIVGLSILNSLPPSLKYSNNKEVLIFFIILVINYSLFWFVFKGFSGLVLFISSVFLYFMYFIYYTHMRTYKR